MAYLEVIHFKDDWLNNYCDIERVSDVSKITRGVIWDLNVLIAVRNKTMQKKTTEIVTIIRNLLPEDFSREISPKALRLLITRCLDKVDKMRKCTVTKFEEYLHQPLFSLAYRSSQVLRETVNCTVTTGNNENNDQEALLSSAESTSSSDSVSSESRNSEYTTSVCPLAVEIQESESSDGLSKDMPIISASSSDGHSISSESKISVYTTVCPLAAEIQESESSDGLSKDMPIISHQFPAGSSSASSSNSKSEGKNSECTGIAAVCPLAVDMQQSESSVGLPKDVLIIQLQQALAQLEKKYEISQLKEKQHEIHIKQLVERNRTLVNENKHLKSQCASKDKGTQTGLKNIDKDIVQLDCYNDDSDSSVVTGHIFSRHASRCAVRKYATLPLTGAVNSKVSRRQMQNRARTVCNFITELSQSTSQSEKSLLLKEIIIKEKSTFVNASNMAGLKVQRKMSVSEASQMQSLLRLSNEKMRGLRRLLDNTNIGNFLPSEPKIRKQQLFLTRHLSEEKVDAGKMLFEVRVNDNITLLERGYLKVLDLQSFIEDLLLNVTEFRQDAEFEDVIWLLFSGDKGGNSMKFHIEIINDKLSGSRDCVHTFCTFEAPDSLKNMWKIFSYYRNIICEFQKEQFQLAGRKIKVFLGGDYDFLSKCLGHQGQSASFPSLTDLVTLHHLRTHTGHEHSRNACTIEKRNLEDYQQNFAENVADDREPMNMRKHAKDHNSVIDKMIFPIKNLDNIVPSILHIHLGIVLELFNQLEITCKRIDNTIVLTEQTQNLDKEIDDILGEIKDIQNKMLRTSCNIIDINNILSRLKATLNDPTHHSLDKIASGLSRNSKKRIVEKCNSPLCVISEYDINRSWIACGNECCIYTWSHVLCQGISESESQSYEQDEEKTYLCLKCQGITTAELFETDLEEKLQDIQNHLDMLKQSEILLMTSLDTNKSQQINKMGPKQQQLNNILKNLNVERQAYHGNVFVGNHCKKILHNFNILCDVLDDGPEKEKFQKIFEIFSAPRDLLFAKRFLSENEITFACRKCEEFCEQYPLLFPGTLKPKMHFYSFDVPRFIKKHKTLGLLSEEEGESLHSAIKMENRVLACVRDPGTRMHLSLKRHALRSQCDKNLIKPSKRLCSN